MTEALQSLESVQARCLIRIVDDDQGVRDSFQYLLEGEGWLVRTYESVEAFLERDYAGHPGCILLDVRMPGMSGLQLQSLLNERSLRPSIIFISAHGTIPMAVEAVKNGAYDFLTKPVDEDVLLDKLEAAARADLALREKEAGKAEFLAVWRRLTVRETQVAVEVATGDLNKVIADRLGISERTVQLHRANVMHKLGIRSAAELATLLTTIGIKKSAA